MSFFLFVVLELARIFGPSVMSLIIIIIIVDEHVSEEQLATAVAALRQRETVLQSLLEAEASRLGDLLVQEEEEEEAQREDQTQEALT